jgi:hypothetical protein
VSLAVFLLLPAFCTFGPAWLVHWTVGRITAALAPLVAAEWLPAGASCRKLIPSGSELASRATRRCRDRRSQR